MRRRRKTEIKSVVLYVRVSTAEQAEQGLSLDAQRGALERYAREHGYEVIRSYDERGASGTDDNRPAFRRMTGDVLHGDLAGRVDAILVLMTSRFMRDSMKARVWKRKLEAAGIRVIATQQDFGDDLNGKLAENIFEALDEYESAVNGERTRLAMRESARQGFFPSARAPFGFRAVKIEIRPNVKRSRLEIDAREAEILREVFTHYVGGMGSIQVSHALNKRGLRYRGDKPWTKDRVLKVVSDSSAIGRYVWGRDDDEPVVVTCDAIVEKAVFEAAQRLRDEREPAKNPGRTSSSPLLLARIAFCGHCEKKKLVLETSGKKTATKTMFRYYNCREYTRGLGKAGCAGVRIGEAELDRAVMDQIATKVFTPERCRALLVELLESSEAFRERTAEQRKNLKRDLDDVERKIRVWESHVEEGTMPAATAAERLRELRALRDELRSAIAKVVPIKPPPSSALSDDTIERFRTNMRDALLSGGPLARTYLRFLVERIDVKRREGGGWDVRITARKGSAMKLLYATATADGVKNPPGLITTGGVLTCVADQLRELDSNQRPIG